MVESKKAMPKEPRGNLNFSNCFYPTLPHHTRILDNATYVQEMSQTFITEGFDREHWQDNYIENYSKIQPYSGKPSRFSEYYPGRRNSNKMHPEQASENTFRSEQTESKFIFTMPPTEFFVTVLNNVFYRIKHN